MLDACALVALRDTCPSIFRFLTEKSRLGLWIGALDKEEGLPAYPAGFDARSYADILFGMQCQVHCWLGRSPEFEFGHNAECEPQGPHPERYLSHQCE